MPTNAPRRHPKSIGDETEAMVLARLVQAGKRVLLPFGENSRYDMAIDEGGKLVRIQCKTGRLKNGAVNFATCSTTYHHPNNEGAVNSRQTYAGDVDAFGVYCRATGGVYLVPIEHVAELSCGAALRVEPTRNNQSEKVRWAKDYELKPG